MNIAVSTGHTFHVRRTDDAFSDLSDFVSDNYVRKYIIRNWDEDGTIFFYMARYKNGEYHVWYRNSRKMWSGFSKTIRGALEGAIRDGWLYA